MATENVLTSFGWLYRYPNIQQGQLATGEQNNFAVPVNPQ